MYYILWADAGFAGGFVRAAGGWMSGWDTASHGLMVYGGFQTACWDV
ncbi:hypothetical protein [Neisseria sp. 74A18]|nr:hypothetical protein [Neisseria sp. 74A18]